MGVIACDRSGCKNIMCDRLILDGTQHICEECYDELLLYKKEWPKVMTKREIRDRIVGFMNTLLGSFTTLKQSAIDEEFDRLTGNDRND